MQQIEYAVMDVETTNGDPRVGRIMEVALVMSNGREVTDSWSTLVDPRIPIPGFMRQLTGIDNKMLKNAPMFIKMARLLEGFTRNRVIVAHNSRFDMTVLEHEFARTGLPFERHTLCTENISRQLLPNIEYYNLVNLCRYFGIEHKKKHRAGPDAHATAMLLHKLLEGFGEERVLECAAYWPAQKRA